VPSAKKVDYAIRPPDGFFIEANGPDDPAAIEVVNVARACDGKGFTR